VHHHVFFHDSQVKNWKVLAENAAHAAHMN